MGHLPARYSRRFDFSLRSAESQRFSLGEQVGHQEIVMRWQGVQGLAETDKVTGDQLSTLMDKLIERMLAIGAGLSPIDRARWIVDTSALPRHLFAIALHGQLLQIGRKTLQVLLVRQHRSGLGGKEIVVPHG